MDWSRPERSPADEARYCGASPRPREARVPGVDGGSDYGAAAAADKLGAAQHKPEGWCAPMPSRILQTRLEALGYDLDEEAEYPGTALFHGKTFEIFPAGALGPYRIEHSGGSIRKIVAVDPGDHDVVFEAKELIVDPMSERLAFGGKRGTAGDAVGLLRSGAMDRGRRSFGPCRDLAEYDRGGGRPQGSGPRVSDAGRMEKAVEADERAASEGGIHGHPGLLEVSVAEEGSPRVRCRNATGWIAAALRRGGRGRPARDGAYERDQGRAFRRLGRGERAELERARFWPTSTPASSAPDGSHLSS